MKSKFEFDEAKHVYTLDGKRLNGVTTVLGVISKGDGITQWAANQVAVYIEENCQKLKGWFKVSKEDLINARNAWKANRDSAGTKGKDIHALLEQIVKEAIQNEGYVQIVKHEDKQIDNFLKWAIDKKVKFLESEIQVYSKELWLGGTIDFVCEIDGKLYVGDFKTAKTIYPINFWQCSAYAYMLNERGLYKTIPNSIIVRLGKDGSFETKENYSYLDNIEGFKSALVVYRKLNLLK